MADAARRWWRCLTVSALAALLGACASAPRQQPQDVQARIAALVPARVPDRAGWAQDIARAFAAQSLDPGDANLCAVLAVVEQESNYQADPPVPGLARIARAEIDRRAAALHVPGLLVDAALKLDSPDGRSYAQRLAAVRTEGQLSRIFEDFSAGVPLGRRLLEGFNPVHTGGPMQVSVAFALEHQRGYPYPVAESIRREVFSRRGGLYFGVMHLLGYPADYPQMRYRFADFNAGHYASRNAAFQAALARAAGVSLALDGDLLAPGAAMEAPGATEAAVRALAPKLAMDDAQIRHELRRGDEADFADSPLYARVFALAEARAGQPLPRAILPGITLESPKITRQLTTAWFAERVDGRYRSCLARAPR
ncbi:MAG: DUF1615 domain-containing protein [Pseudoxanthomonas sp.]